MSLTRRINTILQLLVRNRAIEEELDAEVEAFYQVVTDRYMAQGMSQQEARRLAHLKFNTAQQVKEQVRESRTGAGVGSLLRDLKYSFRSIRKARVFSLVTVLTLAVGIGANSTIFSIVSRFVLQPLRVGDPGTLMALHTATAGECCNAFSWPLFSNVRAQARSFSGLASYYELVPASIGGGNEPQRVWGQATTSNFFAVAELTMPLGRGFLNSEEDAPVVVLGHNLWQRRFGADHAIVGKTVALSGRPFTVVGVAPPAFRGLDFILDCQFWVPLGAIDQLLPKTSNRTSRVYHWVAVVARLKPGVAETQAAAELSVLGQRIANAHSESDKGLSFRFERAGSLPPRDKAMVLMFLAALSIVALLVLCIACANVANLYLAHTSERSREMAIRLALGAGRTRLLRQLVTESLLLAFGGGFFGIALSLWATRALSAFRFPAPVPLDLNINVDWRVLLYGFTLSVAAGLLFGLIPARTAVRPLIVQGLKGEDLLGRPGGFWTLRNVLVVSQVAMSLILLCATALFLRSLRNAGQIDIGFRNSGLLMMAVDPRLHGYSPERTLAFLSRLRQRVAALPGVVSASYTDSVPLVGGNRSDSFRAIGEPNQPASELNVELYMTGPDYFATLGTPLFKGREIPDEQAARARRAVVNEVLANKLFPNQNPIGKLVSGRGVTYEITGVAKNIKSRFLGEDYRPVLYRSLAEDVAEDPSVVGYRILVRFRHNPASIAGAVRREIQKLDPALAIFDAETIEDHLRDALFLPRLAGAIFGIFGAIGLLLASVGLYGVMNYWVTRRTREIGIRLAVGARIGEVQRLIIGQGMRLTAVAIVPGMLAAWMTAKLFRSLLYGVAPNDLLTFLSVPLFLAGVALVACWLPSRRAAGAEPLLSLRHE